ncbi:MAG: hypothetical protein FJ288_00285 [Planctomycetes bacterium]|nr:hypothetical protein [Planctomycetota bacterium]
MRCLGTLGRAAATVGAAVLFSAPAFAGRGDVEPALRDMVEADWAAQESRLGRTPESPDAVRAALKRAGALVADLGAMPAAPDVAADAAAVARLRDEAKDLDSLDAVARLDLYRRTRWAARDLALRNPLLAGKPLVFMKRNRFICQMLHEYVAYFDEYGRVLGGGVYILESPGVSLRTRDLLQGRLPPGCYATLALSFDARRIFFAFAECRGRPVEWGSPEHPFYHILEVDPEGADLRQLTYGRFDDFDPCPLPDGGLAFMSTRRGGFTRCNNPWEPIPVYTLHRMDAGGGNLRTISFHETNEWHPSVLSDGRIIYTRWDYVDRSAANFHGLWAANPDGTAPAAVFGNYTGRINACFQARAIPGSPRIIFVAGAHHADVGGSLAILDPSRPRLDAQRGTDGLDAVERLTPEVPFPEGDGPDGGWPESYFHSPWPLSENYFLVSFGYGKLPGMSSGGKRDSTGLYYLDRFGNLELLYRDRRLPCMYPILLAPRPVPPVIAPQSDPGLGDEGEFILTDVRRSLLALPEGRRVAHLRVYQVLPKTTPTVNQPRIGHANAEGARMLLGTVPVEADGSAYFRAPARRPLYFQAVDQDGRAVQSMRSTAYLQPGERRGCVGCHEPVGAAPPPAKMLAAARGPSRLRPGPDGTQPFSFPRLVQPVLDKHCVRCHDGKEGVEKGPFALTGEPDGPFSRSYQGLKRYLRWFEWGGASIAAAVTRPGRIGADESPLVKVLEGEKHRARITLSAEDRERLLVWIDGNAPFYGTYSPAEQEAQRRGQAVAPPQVQ